MLDVGEGGVGALVELLLDGVEGEGPLDDLVVVRVLVGVGELEEEVVEGRAVGGVDGVHDRVHEALAALRQLVEREAVNFAFDCAHGGGA